MDRRKPASWYERDAAGRPAVPWDWSDTAKLNYAEREVWRAQADAMEFWLTQHDVDGFRCDMAMLVPIEFWNETSLRLRRVKPDLFMLAEAEERNLFEEGAFDACYAWRMHHPDERRARQRTASRRCATTSTPTATTIPTRPCGWRSRRTMTRIRGTAPNFPDWAMRARSWRSSFVVPRGLPLIYTGQEIGYDHSFAFFDRDPIPRYEANAFTGFYRRLTALRHEPGPGGGGAGRGDGRDPQQRRGLPDDAGPRDG